VYPQACAPPLSVGGCCRQDHIIPGCWQNPLKLKLEIKIGVLCNQSIGWFTKTYHKINKPKLIMRAWEHCKAGPFDLSFASLTSSDAFHAYSQLRETDLKLWAELNVDASKLDSASKSDFLEESNE
jgi:hypothetical protein